MIKDERFRTSKKEIAGTTYIVESGECDEAKGTPYSKLKRLITSNAKEIENLSKDFDLYKEINSTSQE